jgi:sigma-E factor negative regulatory protein RseA
MKHEISALMDGELFEDEAESLFDRIKQHPDTHEDWAVYHLIGDVLRQPESMHRDLSAKIRERMRNEPVVLAPRGHAAKQKMRMVALSAAASVAAIGVVAWMSMQVSPEIPSQMAAQQTSLRQTKVQIQAKSNDYLMAHQEFSPNADVNGAFYIRTASYIPDEK